MLSIFPLLGLTVFEKGSRDKEQIQAFVLYRGEGNFGKRIREIQRVS